MLTSFITLMLFFLLIFMLSYIYFYIKNGNIDTKQKRIEYMNNTMGIMFIALACLKIFNLTDFSEIFKQYDLISQSLPVYSKVYPFIELLLGFLFLNQAYIPYIYYITLLVISSNLISTFLALATGVSLPCGCMGGLINLKLSYLSVLENMLMLIMLFFLI